MDAEKIQRFISRQDWISLFKPKPRQKFPKLRDGRVWNDLKQIENELSGMTEELEDLKKRGAEMLEFPGLKEKLQKRQKRRLHIRRLQELAQPKSSLGAESGTIEYSDGDACSAGPGDYEIRLDMTRPSVVSTRPNNPYPIIKDSRWSPKAFRSKEEMNRLRGLESPACTAYSPKLNLVFRSAAKITMGSRSTSHARLREISAEQLETLHLIQKRLERPRLQLDSKDDFQQCEIGFETTKSRKGKYSIPRAVRKLEIKKCKTHTDSLLNSQFNHSFVDPKV